MKKIKRITKMVGYLKRLTRLANLIQIRQRKKGNIEINRIGDKKETL